jgi:acyl transferase domain-containing protein/acyl carrier protein
MEHAAEQDDLEGSLGIAIIGMAARLPGAKDIATFWENLRAGRETIHGFSDEELSEAGVSQAEFEHPSYVKAAPILDDIDQFDAAFFGYSPIEATFMDPQQRLLLECAWQTLEDAGYTGARSSDAIGVYAGIKMNTYVAHFFANPQLFGPEDRMQIMMGNGDFSLSTRISYKLNLKGPSYMLQTACSTSLAAVHLACQALLLDECRMALAGAVAVDIPHHVGYYHQHGGPASSDGHCRPFDAQADGTVFGSGSAMVLLKRLSDAVADGDQIYAVIRGTAVNNDGAVKASFTAPSVEGQTKVIMEALACANLDADSISYVEAHGTATPLGDPIEITALTNAFRASTKRRGFCRIGSVKGNFGHLDATAGMAGLIKTVLALQHKQLPASLHFHSPNPAIDFAASPFVVNTALTDWTDVPLPRRAGVSSFGFGGTNTHVILEEAPSAQSSGASRPSQLLVLSAKTPTALDAATANLAAHLKQNPDLNLADVAYTLHVGRPAFMHRRALVCADHAEALRLLEHTHEPGVATAIQETGDPSIVFMFSGQGSQYANMGRELYQAEPVFRDAIDRCAELLVAHVGLDVREVIFDTSGRGTIYRALDQADTGTIYRAPTNDVSLSPGLAPDALNQTQYAQPTLFVIEYALAQLWRSWGVVPKALIGHSIGEYVAACLAGVFSLEDGLALVAARGRLMQQMPPGAMLMVGLPEADVRSLLDQRLSLAAVNGPTRCVVSGPTDAITQLEQRLNEAEIACRRLHTSHAFHSAMMDAILEPFSACVSAIRLHPPLLPYISNVSGTWVSAEEATSPAYWAEHLRRTVRFADGLDELLTDPDRVLLEVGPGRTLAALAQQHPKRDPRQVILASLHDPKESQSDVVFALNSLGALWLAGVPVSWAGFYAAERRRRLALPTYPFERQRYWFEPPSASAQSQTDAARSEGRASQKPDIADWFYTPSWKRSPLPARGPDEPSARRWLVFADACGLGAQLVEALERAGRHVSVVRAGPAFARLSERAFTVDPRRREDYDLLFGELYASSEQRPEVIVHLWSVTADESGLSALARVDPAQDRGFYSLLFLAQALGKQDSADQLQLVVVSNQLQAVSGEELVQPEKATLLGPVRVIPLEYPNISCRSVDVTLPPDHSDSAQDLVESLLTEIAAGSPDQLVAYRGRHRWAQTFEPIRLEQPQPALLRVREAGVYLITGGVGGIGLAIAGHLTATARAKLILTGRTALPERATWESWLATHAEQDRTSERIRAVQALERAGSEVVVVGADVADRERMRAVVVEAYARFGTIHGVIHAAGVPGGGIIQLKTPELAAAVLAPKVTGALVLDDLFRAAQLDFLVLFSSLSAIVGEFGQVDYCAANAFLDALAYRRTPRAGGPILSINWDMWREVGMTVQTSVPAMLKEWREEQLKLAMLSAQGLDVFDRALSQRTLPQIMICTTDIGAKIEQFRGLTRSRILGEVEQVSLLQLTDAGPKHARPNLRTAYLAPTNETERTLAQIWQRVLGIERVGIQDSFFELGGDSLIGLKLIAQLKQEFGIEIPAVDLYKGPTISRLANIINPASGHTSPDESARRSGQQRGAQRRERRLQQKEETDQSGGRV